jgi:hypothetical protein
MLVDPNYAFNEQLYAMVWGSMFFPTTWSASWIHDARIAVLASDQADWPANETYAFYHPATGLTYRAHAAGSEDVLGHTVQKGTGARMLAWANQIVMAAYLVETDASTGDPIINPDGTPALKLDAEGKPIKNAANPGADLVLQKFVDQIDIFRQLTAEFSRPLSDEDLPDP